MSYMLWLCGLSTGVSRVLFDHVVVARSHRWWQPAHITVKIEERGNYAASHDYFYMRIECDCKFHVKPVLENSQYVWQPKEEKVELTA